MEYFSGFTARAGNARRAGFCCTLFLLLFGLLVGGRPANAQPQTPAAPPKAGQPLALALNPDGTLCPGARGSFDPAGYRMVTDPATAELLTSSFVIASKANRRSTKSSNLR